MLLDDALSAYNAGLSVVPPKEDGTKAPAVKWADYQKLRPDEAQIRRWYGNGGARHGLGLICGRVSGNLETLEFEGRAVEAGLWADFKAAMVEAGLQELLVRIQRGYGERTPSGGIHLLYRCEDPVEGNTKLAQRPVTGGRETLIETRGEGGYVVVAPSSGKVHSSGLAYELLAGGFPTIAEISIDEREALFAIARSFDEMPREEWKPAPTAEHEGSVDRPGDHFNEHADWARDVLEPAGWTRTGRAGGREHWYRSRDGRAGWTSATISPDGRYLYVFSTSTELPTEVGISKWRAFALLHHGGRFDEAAREIRRRISGEPGEIRSEPILSPPAPDSERGSSWSPVDIAAVLAGDLSPLEPTTWARKDGVLMLYPGRAHLFIGEPESCKSWAAQVVAAQVLAAGGLVLYVDFEAEARDVVGHLVALGVDEGALRERLIYVRPEEPLTAANRAAFAAGLGERRPAYTVIDGLNVSMTAENLEPNSNKEVGVWWRQQVRPLQHLTDGPLVVVDHVAKDKEKRGEWAVGGGAKKALVDGAMIAFDPLQQFGRGRIGVVTLYLYKDRPGALRGHLGNGKEIARLRLSSDLRSGEVRSELLVPPPPAAVAGEDTSQWRPTGLMERVSRYLEDCLEPQSKNVVEKLISGKASFVRQAITELLADGHVEAVAGPRGAQLLRSARPFRETDPEDNLVPLRPATSSRSILVPPEYKQNDLVPPRPDLVPDSPGFEGSTSSPSTPPLRGDERDEVVPEPHAEVDPQTPARDEVATQLFGCRSCGGLSVPRGLSCPDCGRPWTTQ